MNQNSKPLLFIFITLVLDVTGLGLILPIMPALIMDLGHTSVSEASRIGGWLTFTYAVMQFIFAPILGALSDRYGRRPVLLIALFGFGVDYLFLALAPTLTWIFVGRALCGITGASITTASAYIADISTNENRAKNFGMVGAAFGLGFIIGPVIGGLLGTFGPRVPFMVAAGLSFLNWMYGYFLLPESLPEESRRKFSWKRANAFGALKSLKKYKGILGLMLTFFLVYVSSHAVQSTWSFFTIEQFQWDETMIGISLGVVGVLVALVQGLLIRIVHPRLGNVKSVYLGFGMYFLGLVLFAFASASWMMFVFLIPYCLGGLGGPALQSLLSEQVPTQEQGELHGTLTSLISLTSIVGPPLMTGLFATFTSKHAPVYFPGAAFMLAAIIMGISIYIAHLSLSTRKNPVPTA